MIFKPQLKFFFYTFIISALIGAIVYESINHYVYIPKRKAQLSIQIGLSKISTLNNKVDFVTTKYDLAKLEEGRISNFIEDSISNMTLEEKVGQLFIWRAQGTAMTDGFSGFIGKVHPGGIILMGDNISPTLPIFVQDMQLHSTKVPLFIAIDQEGGEVERIKSDPNPGARSLSTMSDEEMCNYLKNTSKILKENNVNLNFGTVGDIGWYNDSFISNRTYGNEPNIVTNKIVKSIKCSSDILTTIKHFPGHGRTKLDSHIIIPEITISYDEWKKTDALPFQAGIDNNVDFIMTGHLKIPSIDDQPASLSSKHIQNLRGMGFNGVVVTDDMAMLDAAGIDSLQALDKAIDAGNDEILYVGSKLDFSVIYEHTLDKARKGEISKDRIDSSLRRILRKKSKFVLKD